MRGSEDGGQGHQSTCKVRADHGQSVLVGGQDVGSAAMCLSRDYSVESEAFSKYEVKLCSCWRMVDMDFSWEK